MKLLRITLLLAIIGLHSFRSQANSCIMNSDSIAAKDVIRSFLRAVYETQDEAVKIAHKYIELDNSPGSTSSYSADKRYEVATATIMLLREGKGVSSFSPPLTNKEIIALRIVPYSSLRGATSYNILNFKLGTDDAQYLYVALKDNIIWKYFYVKNRKIYSFDYLLKGRDGPVYLFSY